MYKFFTITLAIICFVLSYLFISQLYDNKKTANDSLITKNEVKYWKDKYGKEHATVEKILISNDDIMNAKVDSIAKTLNVKPKNIKSVTTFSTETKTPPIYIHDTFYSDPYVQIKIVRDSITMSLFDTLVITDYSKKKNLFSSRKYFTDIKNSNKYVKLKEPITIERAATKTKKIIIGPSISWDFVNRRYAVGVSILFYPLSLKL